jgi:SAM-dependent methyltransferase
MAAALGADAAIVATDLNAAMLDHAARRGTPPGVQWRPADAMELPFDAAQFDAVVCQFGAMFFADKPRAYAQARRVLAPAGAFLFNVWDEIAANDFADTVSSALAGLFPNDPPRFLARVPYGCGDRAAIRRDLAAAGFVAEPVIDSVSARTHAPSAQAAATGFCQGTPLRGEIEQRAPDGLARATEVCAQALAKRFGGGAIAGWAQAFVITVE